ncbi:hypothetical protein F5Y15DRAFT_81712 [Xylariaceae sp. FL0016]|nr:hypothetical protein F5Y15DRAFT_81712 [Xylariaceae sp. FL0016]
MASNTDLLTDDYVAELLAKEAKDSSLRYSAMGLDAYKAAKRPASQPKPNTRFLNNIIRDTNHHNRSLLAKESAESEAKLRRLDAAERKKRGDEDEKKRRAKPGPSDTRKRMLGDITSILSAPKKRKTRDEREDATSSAAEGWRSSASQSNSDRKRDTAKHDSKSDNKDFRRELFPEKTTEDRRHSSRSDYKEIRHKSENPGERRERHRSHRERYPHHERSRDLFDEEYHSPDKQRSRKTNNIESKRYSKDDASDSDPLEDIIGPAPPPQPTVGRRGRGANAAHSGIDQRFSPDYDPRADVTPEPEDISGNWDDAAEAFRDRQKMKLQGAARLRSAGFSEDQIRKWEKGDMKDETDVQWRKKGELREWDQGKVIDQQGDVSVRPGWGRPTDS